MPVLATDNKLLRTAFKDLGLREIPGPRAHARIKEMYSKAGHPEVTDDAVAWCAAAMGCWLVEAGYKSTNSLRARSYLTYGLKLDITKRIPRGAIVIFRRGNSEWQGHVAICLHDDGTNLTVLGGNQSDSVNEARYPRAALIGAVRPVMGKDVAKDAGKALAPSAGGEVVDQSLPGTKDPTPATPPSGDVPSPTPTPDQPATDGPIGDVLTSGRDIAEQAAQYWHWAQYILIAISLAMLIYMGYKYYRIFFKPEQEPLPTPGPSIPGPDEEHDDKVR